MEFLLDSAGVSTSVFLFLFLASIVAGFMDTLAGGGGLITLPALILSGVPPLVSLGTNKLQGTIGTATATFVMLRSRRVSWQDVRLLMVAAFIGATIGTIVVQFLNTEILNFAIPAVLLFTALYFILLPLDRVEGQEPKMSRGTFGKAVVPLIGWYDGMFGPGTGSFFALAGVSLRGQGLIEATAVAKTLNFSTNIASLIIFLIAGKVAWIVGGAMMFGQFLGAWVGSSCLLKIDPRLLRLLVVTMCLMMLVRYMFAS